MPVASPLHILFVEDVPSDAELAARELLKSGLEFSWARVDSRAALLDALATRAPDLIISDFAMPEMNGLEALATSIAHDPHLPFIILTGSVNEETAVECLKAGAWDYVLKERRSRLPFAVREALTRKRALVEASAARDALRESERNYRTLADAGHALIWTSGLDGKRHYFNRPWLDFTGRTLEQELGDGWTEGVHPEDLGRCLEVQAAAFDWRGPFVVVHRLRRHDGEYRTVQTDGTPRYDTQQDFLGYVGHCLDISELLRAERERGRFDVAVARAQKMEAIGRLAGGVSHDLNNLLTGILGFCDLLLTAMPPASPYRADIGQIQAVSQRASTLTRQLLAFSRKQRRQPVPLNLTRLVSDLRKPLRMVVPESTDLVFDLAPGVDAVDVDPGEIEQALYSLVINSVDAMADGGTLTVRTSQVILDEAFAAACPGGGRVGPHVSISVTDTGAGIEAGLLPVVVEPFFTTKPSGEGTGLGLSAVYGIVKQSGGYLAAESEVGRGSTFTMYFPVSGATVAVQAPPQLLPDIIARGTETILIAEDDDDLRLLLQRVLQGYGYTVLEAVDGRDALSRWQADGARIDLLLTDIVMPGHSGLDVARRCRESRPSLPVVFMTGYSDPKLFSGLVQDDRTSVSHKPCLPEELVQQIRQLLDRGAADPSASRS